MASVVKIKRSSVQGKAPTTSDLETGEIALNLRDKKLFSSDGSAVFEIGSNVHSLSVGTGGLVIANGAITFPTSDGSADQVLVTNGSGQLSWASVAGASGGLDSADILALVDSDYIKTVDYLDNEKLTFGAGDDLQIYHDGSNSFVHDNGTGDLILRGTNLRLMSGSLEYFAYCASNGGVSLYYDNVAKFNTSSSGIDVNGNIVVGTGDTVTLDADEATVASTSQTSIAEFPHATYGGAKFIVTATQGSKRQITEILVTHDGTNAIATEYGMVTTDSDLATFDVDISGTDVRLLATGTSATSTSYKVAETLIEA